MSCVASYYNVKSYSNLVPVHCCDDEVNHILNEMDYYNMFHVVKTLKPWCIS